MTFIARLWREINAPNGGALIVPYNRAVTAGGHAILGACFAVGGYWWAGFAIAAAYWIIKERADLRRGGAIIDGLEDTLMVWLGTFYGAIWWPAMVLACMAYIMAVAAWRVR